MPIINNIQPVEPFVPHLLVENYGKKNVENSRIGRSGIAGIAASPTDLLRSRAV
jgi:hypothetical protein